MKRYLKVLTVLSITMLTLIMVLTAYKSNCVAADRMYGDCNGDENIDARDALVILQHAAKITTMPKRYQVVADVNADDSINSEDALEVLKYAARIITEFKAEVLARPTPEPTPEPTEVPINMDEINANLHASDIKNIWLCGDSITAGHNVAEEQGVQGWGEFLPGYMNATTKIRNCAVSGASSLSYLNLEEYKTVMSGIQPGDLVVIQFGHNDAPASDKHTDAKAGSDVPNSYKNILLNKYILPVLEAGGKPILSTSMAACSFGSDGKLQIFDYADYVTAVRELFTECAEKGLYIYLMDTNRITSDYYNEIGKAEVMKLHVGKNHYNEIGACYAAGVVAEELSETLGFYKNEDIRDADMARRIYNATH